MHFEKLDKKSNESKCFFFGLSGIVRFKQYFCLEVVFDNSPYKLFPKILKDCFSNILILSKCIKLADFIVSKIVFSSVVCPVNAI